MSLSFLYKTAASKILKTVTCVSSAGFNRGMAQGMGEKTSIDLNEEQIFELSKPNLDNKIPSDRRFDGIIPIKKILIDACRSSGPGGQNVNKRNTKITLSFHLESVDWLANETKTRLAEIHKNKLSKEGFLIIRSDKTRTQTLNIADCLDKLRCYISEAEQPPAPELSLETIELKRKRLERAAMERLKEKRHASLLKKAKSSDVW